MSKSMNSKTIVTLAVILAVIGAVLFAMRGCSHRRTVTATVSATEIALGEALTFEDNTLGARTWLWEFGNGESSYERSGTYVFPYEGRYQVRLKIDDELEKLFLVRVRPFDADGRMNHIVRIDAPDTAVQGEYISFSAEGSDKEWKWEFGESGIIDSREKTAIYAYRGHGTYTVTLSTERTRYPIYHTIEILPRYMETDTLDVMTLATRDIQQKLQNIADGKPFNVNYNYVLRNYLGGNPNVLVTVNTDKRNDYYSYCQGLRIAGRRRTSLDMVYVETNTPGNPSIDHIIVLQSERGDSSDVASVPQNPSER